MITHNILIFYTSEQTRQGEQLLTEQQNSLLYHLMERAGKATFDLIDRISMQKTVSVLRQR